MQRLKAIYHILFSHQFVVFTADTMVNRASLDLTVLGEYILHFHNEQHSDEVMTIRQYNKMRKKYKHVAEVIVNAQQ